MTAIKREERIGGQRLILGDCLEVMPELGPVDAVVTDPPYGILSQNGSAATRRGTRNTGKGVCAWDVSLSDAAVEAVLSAGKDAMIWGGVPHEFARDLRLSCLGQDMRRFEFW